MPPAAEVVHEFWCSGPASSAPPAPGVSPAPATGHGGGAAARRRAGTSFANGGRISVSHAEPWANPHVLPKVLQWLEQEDAPLLFRWRLDPALLRWAWPSCANACPPDPRKYPRHRRPWPSTAAPGSRPCARGDPRLRPSPARHSPHLHRGEEFARAIAAARLMQSFGLDREPVSRERCVEIEPALADAARGWWGDYAVRRIGDAHKFTQALAGRCAARGVVFRYGTSVDRIATAAQQVAGVLVSDARGSELLTADAYVLALGSHSPLLAQPLGLRLPVYPAKVIRPPWRSPRTAPPPR